MDVQELHKQKHHRHQMLLFDCIRQRMPHADTAGCTVFGHILELAAVVIVLLAVGYILFQWRRPVNNSSEECIQE